MSVTKVIIQNYRKDGVQVWAFKINALKHGQICNAEDKDSELKCVEVGIKDFNLCLATDSDVKYVDVEPGEVKCYYNVNYPVDSTNRYSDIVCRHTLNEENVFELCDMLSSLYLDQALTREVDLLLVKVTTYIPCRGHFKGYFTVSRTTTNELCKSAPWMIINGKGGIVKEIKVGIMPGFEEFDLIYTYHKINIPGMGMTDDHMVFKLVDGREITVHSEEYVQFIMKRMIRHWEMEQTNSELQFEDESLQARTVCIIFPDRQCYTFKSKIVSNYGLITTHLSIFVPLYPYELDKSVSWDLKPFESEMRNVGAIQYWVNNRMALECYSYDTSIDMAQNLLLYKVI